VLAIVQKQEQAPVVDMADDQLDERHGLLFTHVEHIGDRLDDKCRLAQRGQFHEPDTVLVRADLGRRGLDRQPGLAGAAGTRERECPTADKQPLDLPHLALAPDKAAELDGQVVPPPPDHPVAEGTA